MLSQGEQSLNQSSSKVNTPIKLQALQNICIYRICLLGKHFTTMPTVRNVNEGPVPVYTLITWFPIMWITLI